MLKYVAWLCVEHLGSHINQISYLPVHFIRSPIFTTENDVKNWLQTEMHKYSASVLNEKFINANNYIFSYSIYTFSDNKNQNLIKRFIAFLLHHTDKDHYS